MSLSVCCRKQIHQDYELWATAYLDVVNVFSSHDFCSRWVVQSHNSMLYTPKRKAIDLLVSEIVLCREQLQNTGPFFEVFYLKWLGGSPVVLSV